jgi:hypothetical protein
MALSPTTKGQQQRMRERKSQLKPCGNHPVRQSLTISRERALAGSEMAPSSVGSELQSRVIELRNGLSRWSLRCRKYGCYMEAPLRSGAEVRPGSESRAEQYRVSREPGIASCLIGNDRELAHPVNQVLWGASSGLLGWPGLSGNRLLVTLPLS